MAVIQARGVDLAVQIDALGRSLAIVADLLSRYEIPYAWDSSLRRIRIGALDLAPTYRDDAVQASVGWPLVELTLQTGNAPVSCRKASATCRKRGSLGFLPPQWPARHQW